MSAVAFITGITRGLGFALASHLLARGWEVYGCGATSAYAPPGAHGFLCDVSDETAVAAMFAELTARVDGIDLLVNNAAVLGPRTTIRNTPLDAWRHAFAINVDGPFNVSRHAMSLLRKGAVIANISSSVGRRGRANWGAYACSKHAVEGLTDVLAEELHDREVRVLSFNPGGTATDMRAQAYPNEDPATLPTAADIARIIVERALDATMDDSGAKLNCRDFL